MARPGPQGPGAKSFAHYWTAALVMSPIPRNATGDSAQGTIARHRTQCVGHRRLAGLGPHPHPRQSPSAAARSPAERTAPHRQRPSNLAQRASGVELDFPGPHSQPRHACPCGPVLSLTSARRAQRGVAKRRATSTTKARRRARSTSSSGPAPVVISASCGTNANAPTR